MFRVRDKIFRKELKKVRRFLNDRNRFPDEVYSKFVNTTPKDQGNAQSKTKLDKVALGWKISGDYDYSGVIDEGLYPNPPSAGTGKTSGGYSIKNLRKARPKKGLVDPTVAFIEKTLKKVIRRL